MATAAPWNDRVRRRLKLRDVDILLAVIQTGSMGKAAASLNMSQPAVSKSIAYLEHTLGVRLVDRSRQGVEATPYGRALVKRGVAMFDELRQGVHDIAVLADPAAGEVRAGGSEGTVSGIFSPVVHRFSGQYPRMSFHIIVGDVRSLSRESDARRIDVVVSRITRPPPEDQSVQILFEDYLVVATGANNPLARRRKIELAESLDEPWTFQPSENNFGALAACISPQWGLSTSTGCRLPPHPAICAANCSQPGRYLTVTLAARAPLSRRQRALRPLAGEIS